MKKCINDVPGHLNIRGPQLFYSFFIRWMKVVLIGALFADWSCFIVFVFNNQCFDFVYCELNCYQKCVKFACNYF